MTVSGNPVAHTVGACLAAGMDLTMMLSEYDSQMRLNARSDGPGARVERVGEVVRQVGTVAGDWSAVLWSGLDADTADAAIADQIRDFSALRQDFEWKLYSHDQPGDLAARLTEAGFVAEPAEALLVAEVAALPTQVKLPEGVRLRQVDDEAGVELMMQVHRQAFGTESEQVRHALSAQLERKDETVVAVVAMAGEQPISAGRLELHPPTGFASIWSGGTVPQWRGRGVYKALVAYRTAIAAQRGFQFLQVDATDDSRPILQRLGFVQLATTTPFQYRLPVS